MATNTNYRAIARQAAKANGIDPNVFERQIQQESGFNPNARSGAGAIGIAQFEPGTARSIGVDPMNPVQALNGAAKLMGSYVRKYGSMRNALIAYNAGPGKVGGPLPLETQNYIKTILGGSGGSSTSPTTSGPPKPPTTPGVPSPAVPDAGATGGASARRAALQNYILTEHTDPNALLSLAANLNAAKNTGTAAAPTAPATVRAGLVNRRLTSTNAKPGTPVARLTSEGGLHPTEGLAGYPAHDYFAPSGSAAVAPVTGKVVRLSGHDPSQGPIEGPHGPLGWSVYIQGSDGRTYYLTHMGSRNVKVGQTVKQGQQIGTVADYAKYGTPSHIHMGVHG